MGSCQKISQDTYKHLKGQLDPPDGNGNVFCTKGGHLDPPVGNGNIFCTKGGQLDPPVSLISSYNLFQGKQNCQMLKYN